MVKEEVTKKWADGISDKGDKGDQEIMLKAHVKAHSIAYMYQWRISMEEWDQKGANQKTNVEMRWQEVLTNNRGTYGLISVHGDSWIAKRLRGQSLGWKQRPLFESLHNFSTQRGPYARKQGRQDTQFWGSKCVHFLFDYGKTFN